jgi:cytochrome c-type biogenesis protein CcmE
MTRRKTKYLIGAAVILLAVGALIYTGVKGSVVYFYTPTEVAAQTASLSGKALRIGGMVANDSVRWDPKTLLLSFALTDGQGTVQVRHKGTAPDLFKEGAGAVVEGTWSPEGYFRSSTIMAKHSEEYKPPTHPESLESKKDAFKSLQKEEKK